MGAAIAAGTAAGIYRDIEEGCAQVVRYKDFMIEPVMENHKIYQEYYELYKEMYRESSSVIERLTLVGRRKPYKDK